SASGAAPPSIQLRGGRIAGEKGARIRARLYTRGHDSLGAGPRTDLSDRGMEVRGMVSSRSLFVAGALLLSVAGISGRLEAREPEECQLAWGQAVRSYLTQNRTKGPEDAVFAPACELEAKGKKDEARVEAAIIGVKALAKLDPKGCAR